MNLNFKTKLQSLNEVSQKAVVEKLKTEREESLKTIKDYPYPLSFDQESYDDDIKEREKYCQELNRVANDFLKLTGKSNNEILKNVETLGGLQDVDNEPDKHLSDYVKQEYLKANGFNLKNKAGVSFGISSEKIAEMVEWPADFDKKVNDFIASLPNISADPAFDLNEAIIGKHPAPLYPGYYFSSNTKSFVLSDQVKESIRQFHSDSIDTPEEMELFYIQCQLLELSEVLKSKHRLDIGSELGKLIKGDALYFDNLPSYKLIRIKKLNQPIYED